MFYHFIQVHVQVPLDHCISLPSFLYSTPSSDYLKLAYILSPTVEYKF